MLHILQSVYVGNTVCTARTDERKEVGGQEVENKRNALSDLSDCLDYMQGKKRWRRRRGAPQESLTRPERPVEKRGGYKIKKKKTSAVAEGRKLSTLRSGYSAVHLVKQENKKIKPQPRLKQTLAPYEHL